MSKMAANTLTDVTCLALAVELIPVALVFLALVVTALLCARSKITEIAATGDLEIKQKQSTVYYAFCFVCLLVCLSGCPILNNYLTVFSPKM